MDTAQEVMAWDRIGFVMIEAFFCCLAGDGGLSAVGYGPRCCGRADRWVKSDAASFLSLFHQTPQLELRLALYL